MVFFNFNWWFMYPNWYSCVLFCHIFKILRTMDLSDMGICELCSIGFLYGSN